MLLDVLKSPIFPFMILPASQKDKPARGIDIIGTGPFSMGEWVKDSHLVIKRFDGYVPDTQRAGPRRLWPAARPPISTPCASSFIPRRRRALPRCRPARRNSPAASRPSSANASRSDKELAVREAFPIGGTYVIVNSQFGLTANVVMRQAIGAAIDINEITEATGGINKAERRGCLSPTRPTTSGDSEKAPWYDIKSPAKAKELLKQAGYNNEKIIIETNSNYPWMRTTMLVVAEQLKAAGMNVDVRIVDWTTNASHMQQGTGEWNLSTTLFGPDHILGPQQWRPLIYAFPSIKGNDALDAAYAEFFAEPDLEKRRAAWLKIQQQVLGNAYMIKIADSGRLNAYARKLKGSSDYRGILQLWDLYLE